MIVDLLRVAAVTIAVSGAVAIAIWLVDRYIIGRGRNGSE